MMRKDSTLGLAPERLARLLGITLHSAAGKGKEDSAQDISELIRAHLAGTLPFDTTVIDELPVIIGRLRNELIARAGETLGAVLTSPESDLDTLKKVRQYAKRMASSKSPKAKHAVAVAIYFAAIANALVFHHTKMTTHSYGSLRTSFGDLAKRPWMPTELVRLLTKAHKICRKKAQ
ncbi:MAG: hypothetical protein AMJ65_13030 [Phycisphaerae bacterium SG8_4]|nr:MAG: hypothetical protein AMJ65_13030 [Phycisphaerae bacterium SG8_4]